MAKKKGKKQRRAAEHGYAQGNGYGYAGYGAGYGQAPQNPDGWQPPPHMAGHAPGPGATEMGGLFGMDAGLLQGLPTFLRSRHTEQFLLGLLVGGAAAWVLGDEELRGKLLKSTFKLYAGLAGGLEEFKEQMADVKAELNAEQRGER